MYSTTIVSLKLGVGKFPFIASVRQTYIFIHDCKLQKAKVNIF